MKIGIILLAAGAGKRFGGNKLMADVGGKPLYLNAMEKTDRLEKAAFKVVVTGSPVIAEAGRRRGFLVVENCQPEMGISRSVALGTEAAQKAAPDGLLFMVCDQPWLREATLKSMLDGYNGGILALKCREQTGNPVIFPREYFEELKALSGDRGGRRVMQRHKDRVQFLEIDDSKELQDIDFKEDLKKDKR